MACCCSYLGFFFVWIKFSPKKHSGFWANNLLEKLFSHSLRQPVQTRDHKLHDAGIGDAAWSCSTLYDHQDEGGIRSSCWGVSRRNETLRCDFWEVTFSNLFMLYLKLYHYILAFCNYSPIVLYDTRFIFPCFPNDFAATLQGCVMCPTTILNHFTKSVRTRLDGTAKQP